MIILYWPRIPVQFLFLAYTNISVLELKLGFFQTACWYFCTLVININDFNTLFFSPILLCFLDLPPCLISLLNTHFWHVLTGFLCILDVRLQQAGETILDRRWIKPSTCVLRVQSVDSWSGPFRLRQHLELEGFEESLRYSNKRSQSCLP